MKVTAYFDDIHYEIINQINDAKTSIYVALYCFSNVQILNALCKKASQGVLVDLLMFDDVVTETFIDKLRNSKCSYSFIAARENNSVMHNKFCVIDNATVITGSYNWTELAKSSDENIVIIQDDRKLAQNFIDRCKLIKLKNKQLLKKEPSKIGNRAFFNKTGEFYELMREIDSNFKDETSLVVNEPENNPIKDRDELLPFFDGQKYGYKKNGKLVIECLYKKVEKFNEGRAAVMNENGKWGFIDIDGKLVIECLYKKAEEFSEGRAAVMNEKEKWGFIDVNGIEIISCKYFHVKRFSEGFAAVNPKEWKWGYVNKLGKEALGFSTSSPEYHRAESFWNGFARVVRNDKHHFYKEFDLNKCGVEYEIDAKDKDPNATGRYCIVTDGDFNSGIWVTKAEAFPNLKSKPPIKD